jgi:C-terminal processing protease CtpA/Prc
MNNERFLPARFKWLKKPQKRKSMSLKNILVTATGLLLAASISSAQDTQGTPDAPPPDTFVGVGLALSVQGNSILVMDVIANTSAAEAHVQPGSVIKEVNGVSTDGMKIKECVDRIRGPEGTTVALELATPTRDATNTVQLTREKIAVPHPPGSNP